MYWKHYIPSSITIISVCNLKMLPRQNCFNNIYVNFWLNYYIHFYTFSEKPHNCHINNKRKKMKKKNKKVWSIHKTLVGMKESVGAIIQRCSAITFFQKIHTIHKKILVLESLLMNILGFEDCNFIKKWLQQRHFPVNVVKLLQTSIL